MFLQILPPDNMSTAQLIFENQLVFVVLGLAIGVFAVLKIMKYLSKVKFTKRPSYTS